MFCTNGISPKMHKYTLLPCAVAATVSWQMPIEAAPAGAETTLPDFTKGDPVPIRGPVRNACRR